MSPIIIYSAVFLSVAALVGALAFISKGDREAEVEERLSALTGSGKGRGKTDGMRSPKNCSARCAVTAPGALENFVSRYLNLRLLFEQANVSLTVPKFLAICGGLAGVGPVPALGGWL